MGDIQNKRYKRNNVELFGKILYKIRLSNNWIMIVTSKAERFYFNNKTKQSVWQMPKFINNLEDEEDLKIANDKLNQFKDLIICLLGMIRGMYIQPSVSNEITKVFGLSPSKDDNEDKKNESDLVETEKNDSSKDEILVNAENDEEVEMGDNDSQNDQENEEFVLGMSDLEDLVSDASDEDKDDNENENNGFLVTDNDFELHEYLEKYNKLSKILKINKIEDVNQINSAINFLKLLRNSKIDPFSSYDLEIDEIIQKPEYIEFKCQNLTTKLQRELWDEYCRINNSEIEDISSVDKCEIDIINFFKINEPKEIQFIRYLKNFSSNSKLPKFYTDFNRQSLRKSKNESNNEYMELCKMIPLNSRQSLYNQFKEFLREKK